MVATAFAAYLLFLSAETMAADFSYHPSLAVSEEYTDNVFESQDNKRADYITRAVPGLALQYKSALWEWDGSYAFDYRYYARRSRNDDTTHNLAVKGLIKVIDEFFLLNLNESYKRVSLDITQDYTKDSLFFNQSDQNIFIASPYFVWRIDPKLSLKTGYRFANTWYREPVAENRTDNGAFAEATYELSRNASLNMGYTFIRQNAETFDYDKHDVYGGGRYEFGKHSFIFGQVGNTWIRYSLGNRVENLFWNAGITKEFETGTATVVTGVKYSEDPLRNITRERFYSASFDYPFDRGHVVFSANYSEFDGTDGAFLDTTKYTVGITGRYELLTDFTGTLAFTADNFVRSYMSNSPRKFYVNAGLSYLIAPDLTGGLNYVFVDYYSPTVITDNRQVNRVILDFRKTF
ncbi:TIGR03016 family PEP-CTERM system-associated outer membrane protein [Geobacter sp.]|uniref:TIGR03016 family PEP-CTERM system-associated outer membrane protein n=1 Tax=Geobacter sp. TaxID=46610 RepID=UPI0026256A90|nr:TIGR03016 family PEP-CTERM system-associated outer membrane protein [Geobacter sp.]